MINRFDEYIHLFCIVSLFRQIHSWLENWGEDMKESVAESVRNEVLLLFFCGIFEQK